MNETCGSLTSCDNCFRDDVQTMKFELSNLEDTVSTYQTCDTTQTQVSSLEQVDQTMTTLMTVLLAEQQVSWTNAVETGNLACEFVYYVYCDAIPSCQLATPGGVPACEDSPDNRSSGR
eukprot:UN25793